LHFSENVKLEIEKTKVLVTIGTMQYIITCDENSKPTIATYYLSYNYGHKTTSRKVTFETKISGTSELHFTIEKLRVNE